MEPCLICGEFYDPMIDSNHEDICGELLTAELEVDYKPNEELMKVLEAMMLDEEAKKTLEH